MERLTEVVLRHRRKVVIGWVVVLVALASGCGPDGVSPGDSYLVATLAGAVQGEYQGSGSFSQATTAGDPNAAEWSTASGDRRHTLNLQASYAFTPEFERPVMAEPPRRKKGLWIGAALVVVGAAILVYTYIQRDKAFDGVGVGPALDGQGVTPWGNATTNVAVPALTTTPDANTRGPFAFVRDRLYFAVGSRLYAGPHPVVAHPPCQRWGKLWAGQPLWIKRTGERKKKGDEPVIHLPH